jgi:hypothetical protein
LPDSLALSMTNEAKLVNFRLPTADQFSAAVDTSDENGEVYR